MFLVLFVGALCFGISLIIQNPEFYQSSESNNSDLVFDAMQFYTNDNFDATVDEQQLIQILGAPEKTEEWNYDTETKSYPIKTLYYNNETYAYHFNAERLQRISINDVEIPYANKNKILSMFNLKKYKNTFVVADTGVAYRVKNCGVHGLWIAIMDEDSLDSIRIDYGTLFSE